MLWVKRVPQAAWSTIFLIAGLAGCVEIAPTDGPRLPESDSAEGTDTTLTSGRSAPIAAATTSTATAGAGVDLVADAVGCLLPGESESWTAEVLRLTNALRREQGAPPLAWSDALAAQAGEYACEMIDLGFFAHVNPETGESLRDRADRYQYDYWAIGENLAGGQTTPAQVVREWFDSPSHRENLLNPAYTELGIAVRLGGEYRIYWVQEFGRPISEGPYEGE
jgi:uncharacterized protein YkwD